jgi:hypothetical protein
MSYYIISIILDLYINEILEIWGMNFHSTELQENAHNNKRFWEELIAYFPFTVI